MLEAADLTPPIIHTVPEMKFINNVAANYEMFECHWARKSQKLEIYRLRNLIQKRKVHVAQSKESLSIQLKPIRLKHGSVNPSKAMNMKLSLPPQVIYLSLENK